MNFMLILLLQTLAMVLGSQESGYQLQKRKDRRNSRSRSSVRDGNSKSGEKGHSGEKWVVDSIFYDDYQSDTPIQNMASLDFCPPVPDVISNDACAHASCQQDTDCTDGYRCCFTGCSFTCLSEIKPAAVVDWRKEPRRSRSGISWLIKEPAVASSEEMNTTTIQDGTNFVCRNGYEHCIELCKKNRLRTENLVQAEACSTSPVELDEDPLLCPHGYFCHVTGHGNPKKGIPNSGYCVKQTGNEYSPSQEELVISAALNERQLCRIDNIVLLNGANIKLKDKQCRCKKGYISCKKRPIKVRAKKKSKQQKLEQNIKRRNGRNTSS